MSNVHRVWDMSCERAETALRRTAAAIFIDRIVANRAIEDLRDHGFAEEHIGIVMLNDLCDDALRADTDASSEASNDKAEGIRKITVMDRMISGATAGAMTGGVLGGLTGLAVMLISLVVPGIGPNPAGRLLTSTLGTTLASAAAGAGIGAAAGGLIGALMGMGIREKDARYFDSRFRTRPGRVLVTVKAGSRLIKALGILRRNGGDTGGGTAFFPYEFKGHQWLPISAMKEADSQNTFAN